MKNPLFIIALACLLVLVVILLLGAVPKQAEWIRELYIVQPGDTLYSIAAEHGISDWRRWSYEVCEVNGITDGGTICPGDEIIIFREEK